ncbi:MAG: hypothetical protein ACHQ50_08130 [Fimbriimonadales bacterium]
MRLALLPLGKKKLLKCPCADTRTPPDAAPGMADRIAKGAPQIWYVEAEPSFSTVNNL